MKDVSRKQDFKCLRTEEICEDFLEIRNKNNLKISCNIFTISLSTKPRMSEIYSTVYIPPSLGIILMCEVQD